MTTKMKEKLMRSKKVERIFYVSLIVTLVLLILTQAVPEMPTLNVLVVIGGIVVFVLAGIILAMKRQERYVGDNKLIHVVLSDEFTVQIFIAVPLSIVVFWILEKINYSFLAIGMLLVYVVTVRLTGEITTYFSSKLSEKS